MSRKAALLEVGFTLEYVELLKGADNTLPILSIDILNMILSSQATRTEVMIDKY
ncbi:MAG: hypothetical protein QOK81_01485 [Nitrososphaeraceae archaeon]|nr:hypothetical protein [Nitrososphaeraceae archaeon]